VSRRVRAVLVGVIALTIAAPASWAQDGASGGGADDSVTPAGDGVMGEDDATTSQGDDVMGADDTTASRGDGVMGADGAMAPMMGSGQGDGMGNGRPSAGDDLGADALSILAAHCLSCHSPRSGKDPKGGLRLDSRASVLAGGDSGGAVVPGLPDASELVRRSLLPAEDVDAMPPKGDRLSAQDVERLSAWIAAGCPEPLARDDEPVREASAIARLRRLAVDAPASSAASRRAAEAAGAQLISALPGSSLLRSAVVEDRAAAGRAIVNALVSLKPVLVGVDLSGTAATDEDLALLADAPRLVRLDLGDTAVGDAGVRSLGALPELASLVLWRTQVGDATLERLASPGVCPALTDLYVAETKVTDAGLADFAERRPDIRVHAASLLDLLGREPPTPTEAGSR
jgi:mono/diheme cytochrome c family protein